jgi:cysteamine dioxygenase
MDDYDRRQFLRTTVPSFLGILLALPALSVAATQANKNKGRSAKDDAMNWDAFLESVATEAAKQHLDQWNQEDYLKKISALALRLHREDPLLQKGFAQIKTRLEKGKVDFE